MKSNKSIRKLCACFGILTLLGLGCGGPSPGNVDEGTAAPGATGEPQSEPPDGEPQDGDWIVLRLGAEPATLNPYLESSGAYTTQIVANVIEPLITRDNETLEWKPLIAESWEISEDHLTYTFNLRKDVTFSDGVPLTAHDVKFTIETILEPTHDTADIRIYLMDVEKVDVDGDYTIRITCSKPYFLHLSALGELGILPKHIYSQGDFNTHPNNRRPIGSGPFVFESWETNSLITLEKNESYWREERPHVAKLLYKFITDDNAAFLELQRHGIDRMRLSAEQWVNRASRKSFEEEFHKYTFYSSVDGYLGAFSWIGWNMKRPQFADKRVRQAMTMLLDRQTILDTIFHGLGRVVTGYAFPDSPEYNKTVPHWPYDPPRAWKQLDEAGWVDTDKDGIRDKDGVPLRFEWIYPQGSPEYGRMATVYKEQLDKAGIGVTLRPLEWASFLESVYKRKFDACMMSWVSPPETDPYQIWHSSQTEKGSNYVGFENEEVDRLIEKGRLEFDRGKRALLHQRFHEILHEEQPYTFLFNAKRKVVVDKRFRNINVYPLGFDMHEWWVPKAQQRYP